MVAFLMALGVVPGRTLIGILGSRWTPRFLSRSFQVLFGPSRYSIESYLWQPEAPKKVLWTTLFFLGCICVSLFQAGYCLFVSQCMSCRSCRLQWDRLGCKIFDLPQARTRYISDINLRVSQCPGNRCIDQEVLLIQTALQNDAVI